LPSSTLDSEKKPCDHILAFQICQTRRPPQRRRELCALDTLDPNDVELVEDEQWGRVLVARRDFAPGELVIRSRDILGAGGLAEYVQHCDQLMQHKHPEVESSFAQHMAWASSSPR
jgi:hypothetical protein